MRAVTYRRANAGIAHSLEIEGYALGIQSAIWEANTAAPRGTFYAFKSAAGIWHAWAYGAPPRYWTRHGEGRTRDEAVAAAVRAAEAKRAAA